MDHLIFHWFGIINLERLYKEIPSICSNVCTFMFLGILVMNLTFKCSTSSYFTTSMVAFSKYYNLLTMVSMLAYPWENFSFFIGSLNTSNFICVCVLFFLSCYQTSCSNTFPPTPSSTLVAYTSSMQLLQPFVNHTWHLEWIAHWIVIFMTIFMYSSTLASLVKRMDWNIKIVNLMSWEDINLYIIHKLVQIGFQGCVCHLVNIDFSIFA
jgi:hypothetical protein